MSPSLPWDEHRLANLKLARGHLEVDWAANQLWGWVVLPEGELRSVQVYANGTLAGTAATEFREQTAQRYRWLPHAGRSLFRMRLSPLQWPRTRVNPVAVVGYRRDTPSALWQTLEFPPDFPPPVPIPPPELIDKTQGGHDETLYKTLGYRYYYQLLAAISRHRNPCSLRRVLDFGCGSGRVAANILAQPGGPQVFGCDIDPEAIAFCQEYLRPGQFIQIGDLPLPYPDATFDGVISLALFPAFDLEHQRRYLSELQRVTAPKGLVLVSLQGVFSASFEYPLSWLPRLFRGGIFDRRRYEALEDGEAKGEYRGVFQTRAFTLHHWSKFFEILEYDEGEINADQDLVVMRRRG